MTLPSVLAWFAARDSGAESGGGARRPRDPSAASSANAVLSVDEHTLLDQLRNNDPAAIETIVQLYGALMHRVAVRTIGSSDGADDVVQEVLFRVWEGRASLQLPAGMRGYLIRASRNQALNTVTSRAAAKRRDMAWESQLGQITYNDAERELSAREVSVALRRILTGVPPRAREIFLLSWEDDLSYAEIAALLDISVATVRNQMSRAGRRLAEYLAEHSEL